MKFRNGTFFAALAASLLIHLLAIPISVRVYFGKSADEESAGSGERFEEMVVRMDEPNDSTAPPADDPGAVIPDKNELEKSEAKAPTPTADEVPEPLKPDLAKLKEKNDKLDLDEFVIGDAKGTGYASHDTPGDVEAMAKQANEDQAFLSRDPVGNGRVGNEPSPNTVQGKNGRGGTPGEAAMNPVAQPKDAPSGKKGTLGAVVKMPSPEQISARVTQWVAKLRSENPGVASAQSPVKTSSNSLAAPKPTAPAPGKAAGIKEEASRTDETGTITVAGASIATRRTPKIASAPVVDAKSIPTQSDARVAPEFSVGDKDAPAANVAKNVVPPIGIEKVGEDLKPQPLDQQAAVARNVGNGDGRAPGSNAPAADPAPMSDSESDAFSKLGSTVIRDGKMEIKFGRKLRSVRPRFTLAGQIDLMSMDDPKILLEISIDTTGRVTGVEVLKSSGSNEVDQPVRRTMYEWWFEPKKDKNGNLVPDHFKFPINWVK